MQEIRQWLLLDPLDTLFFRGGEAMIAGEDHEVTTVFPPLPSTLAGALCTAALLQRGLLSRFLAAGAADPALPDYPLLGRPGAPALQVLGPLFQVTTRDGTPEYFFPAPAHWFITSAAEEQCKKLIARPEEEREKGEGGKEKKEVEVEVRVGEVRKEIYDSLGLRGTVSQPVWVQNPPADDPKSLTGFWANRAAFEAVAKGDKVFCSPLEELVAGRPTVLPLSGLYVRESRVGIALERATRRVRRGHLYSTTQVRLLPQVKIVAGLDQELIPPYLDPEGLLVLGGEQRVAHYQELTSGPALPQGNSDWLLALMPQPFALLVQQGWRDKPRASGPLVRRGGWDLHKQFHKDTVAYLPAGTVIKVEDRHAALPFGFLRL